MTDRVTEVLDIVRRVSALGEYDSNVIGMAAEIIAEDVYGMRRVPRGTRTIDGTWWAGTDQRTVQVKAWSEARVKRYRHGTFFRVPEASAPDDLLVLLIYSSKAGYDVLYKGPTTKKGYIENNGVTRVIRFDHLKSIDEIQTLLGDSTMSGRQMADPKPAFRVRALTVVCTDMKRSVQFYETVLGASAIPTDNGIGRWYRLGEMDITLLPNAAERSPATFPTHAMPILWMEVDDLSEAAKQFNRYEVKVVEPGDGQYMRVADPDGLLIEVWQSQPDE